MATTFNHASQAFDATQEKSFEHMNKKIKQEFFTFDSNMDLDPNDDRGNALGEVVCEPNIEDPHCIKLTTKSMIPLYPSCEFNSLTCTLMILNTCATHRCINGFIDKSLLFLPKPNNLFKLDYEAKSLIQNLGLKYDTIHSCENGCALCCNEHVVIEQNPSCGQPQYVQGHAKVPKKMFGHFPIIPIFQGLCSHII
jgi:hypothetical protein